VTSLKAVEDGAALIVRLYNPGELEDEVALLQPAGGSYTVYRSDFWDRALEPLSGPVALAPHEILTLRIER
jgi:alpha-mannosidase